MSLFDFLRVPEWIKQLLAGQQKMKEIIMSVKDAVQANADALGVVKAQLQEGLENLTADIAKLSGPLSETTTEAEVNAILQPHLDALRGLADALAALAAVTPGPETPPEEPPVL